MTTATARYDFEQVEAWAAAIFEHSGVSPVHARETARVLVRTNLRGVDTHGVSRIAGYLQKIRTGEVNARAEPNAEFADGLLRFNGDGGLGQAVAMEAVRLAVARARDASAVICLIRESGHLAAIGQFVLEAAEAGMVAVLCQETPPLMALKGSKRPAIGNNPIAFAAPVAGGVPLVFDTATSVVARGNVLQAIADKAESIPDGWAIDAEGRPTTNPAAALKGAMLPIAGHKGIGLAMLVQILAGSLTGSLTATSAAAHGAMSSAGNISAFLLVLNPERFVGREAFDAHVADWLGTYKEASGPESRYPGERAAACEAERRKAGIPIAASTRAELAAIGETAGVPFDLRPNA